MNQNSYIAITTRAFEFLKSIDTPMSVDSFIQLELTGDPTADALLSYVSRMMLEKLREDGAIHCDPLASPNPKIHGLTPKGVEMHQLFLKLTKA